MNNFINRDRELARLESGYARTGGTLTVLYGRRRLGKTALLRQFVSDKPYCYFMGDRAIEHDLRRALAMAMAESLNEPTLAVADYSSWYDLFAAFDRLRDADQPFVLIFDEYQYLCQVQSAFSTYIQKWWDEHWKGTNLHLILCGSVTSMMYRETLASSAPLYGRSDLQILLRPIPFVHIPEFLPNRSPSALVEFHALTGGVPRYLELARPYRSLEKALVDLVLDPLGPLHDEGRDWLQEEMQTPHVCWSILHAIGSGANRISEIAARMQQPANKLTRYLELLQDLSLVRRDVPVLERVPAKSKKGLYVVEDAFCRLWFGTIAPYGSFLEIADVQAAYPRIESQVQTIVAQAFEDVCRQWTIKRAMDFGAIRVGRQWSKHYEFDVAGVDADGNLCIAGECKWSNKKMGMAVLDDLNAKITDNNLPVANGCHTILFSKNGFSSDLERHAESEPSLVLVDVGQLVEDGR